MADNSSMQDLVAAPWRMLMIIGAAAIILGVLMIVAAPIATVAMVVVLGCLILAGGVTHLVELFTVRGWGKLGHLLLSLLYLYVGARVIAEPGMAALSLTMIAGILLLVAGMWRIVAAARRRAPHRGWIALSGALSVLLGALVLWSWPVSGMQLIGTFVGVDLMLHGWATALWATAARATTVDMLEHEPSRREREYEMAMRHW